MDCFGVGNGVVFFFNGVYYEGDFVVFDYVYDVWMVFYYFVDGGYGDVGCVDGSCCVFGGDN